MNLRPMTMADADKMLEWKNYPETRKFAIASQEEVKLEDHLKYLEKNLHKFQVIVGTFDTYGAIRIDDNEISIWVDRVFWGQGIATRAIRLASKEGMTAKIVEGNIASMKAFVKCGYVPVEYVKHELLPNRIYKAEELKLHQPNYYILKCV